MKRKGVKQTAPASKTDAQRRADQIRSFQAELELIEHEKIISLNKRQRTAVTAYHKKLLAHLSDLFDVDISKREKQLSLGLKIASFLGALGLAASVFFLFYQFWGRFSVGAQVCILIASPIMGLVTTMIAVSLRVISQNCSARSPWPVLFSISSCWGRSLTSPLHTMPFWPGGSLPSFSPMHPIRACSWQRGLSA